MKISQVVRWIAAGMLLLALFDLPDEYYKVLRFAVVAAAILEIFGIQKGSLSQNRKTVWTLAFSAVAIIFNPLLPLEMERETWAWFDVIAAGVFAGFAFPELRLAYLKWKSESELENEKARAVLMDRVSDSSYIEVDGTRYERSKLSSDGPAKDDELENKVGCFYFVLAGVIFLMVTAFAIGLGAPERSESRYPIPDFSKYSTLNENRREDMGYARSAPISQGAAVPSPQPTVRKTDPIEVVDGVEIRKAVPIETPEVRKAIPLNSSQ